MKKILHRSLSLLLTLALCLSLTVPVLAAEVKVTGVTLDQTAVTLTPGSSVTLTATVAPAHATDKTVLWSSNQTSVATVDANGKVTAVGTGTAAITAETKDGSWPALCYVTVENDYVSAVTITPAGPERLPVGTTRQLTAAVTYAHETGTQGVTWSSADPSVATVSEQGLVTAVAEGTVSIIAQSKDRDQSGNTLSALYNLTVTTADPNAAGDVLTLSTINVTGQAGQLQSKTLTAPQVTVLNGSEDVTANYTFGYSWYDNAGKSLPGDETALVTPITLQDYHATCVVAAVSKTDSTKTLTASCTYVLKVLPGVTLGAETELSAGAVNFPALKDLDGVTLTDQLTKGVTDLSPAVTGLKHIVFDLDSVQGEKVGSLNVTKDTQYVLSGSGKKLSDVVFTPAATGTYSIDFIATGSKTYHGQLEIQVTGQSTSLEDVIPCDSAGYNFTGSDFFQSGDTDPVVSMVFGTPTAGKLLRNFVKGSGIADTGARYYTDSAMDGDYHVSTLSYLPSAGYNGLVEIPVTMTTRSGQTIQEVIRMDVISKITSAYFSDVTPSTVGNWAANAVDFAYGCGLVNGVEPGLFGPDQPMTRGMLVTVLHRAAGSPVETVTTNFTDLDPGAYYYNAVVWATLAGVVNGTTDTTFSPDAPVTRQQIAAILYRYAQVMGVDTPATGTLDAYLDKADVQEYALTPVTWAVSQGIISGMTENTLVPLGDATRAQVVVILHRYLIGQ